LAGSRQKLDRQSNDFRRRLRYPPYD
jgi:hypothetical protein